MAAKIVLGIVTRHDAERPQFCDSRLPGAGKQMNACPVDVVLTVFNDGQIDARKFRGNLTEMSSVPAVAREIDVQAFKFKHEAAPKREIALECAPGKMLSRQTGDAAGG